MNHNSLVSRTLRQGALKGVAVLALAGGLAACSSGGNKAPNPSPNPSLETEAKLSAQLKAVERTAQDNLQDHAVKATSAILDIMANPKSGTEQYDPQTLGNKPALVGPDLNSGTPDDAAYARFPEMFARYDPATKLVAVTAYGERTTSQGAKVFNGIDVAYRVGTDSSIATKTGPLNVSDFRVAIQGANLVAANGMADYAFKAETGQSEGTVSGVRIASGGLFEDSFAAYAALSNKLATPESALNDPGKLVAGVNRLTGTLDHVAGTLTAASQS